MAGYQRFVAYVYEYVKGKKGTNCGFIKVEVKEQQCRLELHLRCPGIPEQGEAKIYGFVRNGGLMDGYLLGNCRTREGVIQCLTETDAQNMGNSGIGLERMGGLILETDGGAFFGTEWDDIPIRPENFREIRQSVKKEQKEEKKQETEPVKEETEETENPTESETGDAEEILHRDETGNAEEMLRRDESGDEQADRMNKPEPKEEPELVSQSVSVEENTAVMDKMPKTEETEDNGLQKDEPIMPEMENHPSEVLSEMPDNQSFIPQEMPNDQRMEDLAMSNNQTPLSSPASRASRPQQASRPPQKRPGEEFHPFEDEEITDCRKVHIKDLAHLNRRDIPLRNNRFLQYGYYNFGHLLICCRADGRYILGVPGGYDQQERFMANMFGFPFFKESRYIQLPQGRGGYWYRLINTPDFH